MFQFQKRNSQKKNFAYIHRIRLRLFFYNGISAFLRNSVPKLSLYKNIIDSIQIIAGGDKESINFSKVLSESEHNNTTRVQISLLLYHCTARQPLRHGNASVI